MQSQFAQNYIITYSSPPSSHRVIDEILLRVVSLTQIIVLLLLIFVFYCTFFSDSRKFGRLVILFSSILSISCMMSPTKMTTGEMTVQALSISQVTLVLPVIINLQRIINILLLHITLLHSIQTNHKVYNIILLWILLLHKYYFASDCV